MRAMLLLLCAVIAVTHIQGQSVPAAAPAPQPAVLAAQQRALVNPTSFVYKFNPAGTLATSTFGTVQTLFASDSQALNGLTGDGIAQAVINLNPCALWSPHLHPRANEILYVAQGNLTIGFKEENQGRYADGRTYGGRLLNFTVPQGSSMIVPQGLMHYMLNNNCQQASVVTSFDNKDPGTATVAQQLFSLPYEIISAATGMDDLAISLVLSKLNQQSIVSFSTSCLTACGLPIPAPSATTQAPPTPPAPPVQPNIIPSPAVPASTNGAAPATAPSLPVTSAQPPQATLSTSSVQSQQILSSGRR